MTRNGQNNIINEFNVPKSVELNVLHMHVLDNKSNKVFIMDDGGHI